VRLKLINCSVDDAEDDGSWSVARTMRADMRELLSDEIINTTSPIIIIYHHHHHHDVSSSPSLPHHHHHHHHYHHYIPNT